MVKHTVVGDDAFEALKVKVRAVLEYFYAIWTTAKLHYTPSNIHSGGNVHRLLCEASRADNQVTRFLEIFVGSFRKDLNASLAAELILYAIVLVRSGFLFAHTESYERTPTCSADDSVHERPPFGWNPDNRGQGASFTVENGRAEHAMAKTRC